MELADAIVFIRQHKLTNSSANKAAVQRAFVNRFSPDKERSVFIGNGFAMRFSEARTNSFSNTVLSLSALQKHDMLPFVVVVVREQTVDFLLANTTFLKKISHSSRELQVDNIKGSFNGTDIITEYESVPNSPENFEHLYEQHLDFTWEENVKRLVEATNEIVGRDTRFRPTDIELDVLLKAPERAAAALLSPNFKEIGDNLRRRVNANREAILEAAHLDNVNLRGNTIEQLLTKSVNTHELGDLAYTFEDGRLVIDIKTKLLDKASSPKAYSVDKMLEFLSQKGSVLAFLMIGVNTRDGKVSARLLPVLERTLLAATRVQHHWAGRASRGVTQLSGRFERVAEPNYNPQVDVASAQEFLGELLAL